jgi:thiol-disulfide isomerase/thioredoxin/protocatechuate 3,4-dioxygenase beta subunit
MRSVFWHQLMALLCTALLFVPGVHGTEQPSKPSLGTIAVHVLDGEGKPLADAAVSLFGFDQDWRRWKSDLPDEHTDQLGTSRWESLATDTSYLLRVQTLEHGVGFKDVLLLEGNPHADVDVSVQQGIQTAIAVRDGDGKPVAGASIWLLKHTGANGSFTLDSQSLAQCGLAARASNAAGELSISGLPPGKIDVSLIHADFAPCKLTAIEVGQQPHATARLEAGVRLTFRIAIGPKMTTPAAVMMDLRHEPFDHASTLIGQLPNLGPDGSGHLTVAQGRYRVLRLTHPDYVVIPSYSEIWGRSFVDDSEPLELQSGNDQFFFKVVPKVAISGRVLDEISGKPMSGQTIGGEVRAHAEGPLARFAKEWTHTDWADTDGNGQYKLKVAAGPARVSFTGRGLISHSEHYELEVAADGSTVAPDILVRPIPKVRGTVRDRDGHGVAGAVVRFRGSNLTYGGDSVITDGDGRFELETPWIPTDLKTDERLPIQTVVAFDPHQPLSGEGQVRLADPESVESVELRMQPQDYGSLLTAYPGELNEWQRGIAPADQKEHLAAISLAGKPAPELDGVLWLNTDKAGASLADFRGKYVLLQFWTTWCGPCHADMPSVKLAYQLYGDKGFTVVGVHDNSMPIDDIKKDAAKEGLAYPIVVDHPDGRILARYKEHGISGYPSYLLIGPDGTVVCDDDTVPGPSLRIFKIELIRSLVMGRDSPLTVLRPRE